MVIELFTDKEGFTTKIGAHMEPELQRKVIACLRRNADVFAFKTADLKGIDRELAEHRLNVDPTIKPVKQKTRHFGAEKDAAIREQVQALLEAGHIVEVQYPEWVSNAVMVEKNAKTWRMCVDYRDLNAACPKDCYPLPRIDQLVDATSGCELLSMMDAYQGYHQVKTYRNDVVKTAFAVCAGIFAYVSMSFGLKNAGATYQRMMDRIFKDQLKENVSVYVDDMLVRSAEARTHADDLEEIFSVVRRHKLMLNPAKCTFGVQSGKFLGYKVTLVGIEVHGSVTKEGCGVGIYIESPEDGAYQFAIKFEDKLSNNETEYEAVIRAVHILRELRADTAIIKTDSQLVAQQLRGECEVRDNRMRAYYDQMQQIKKQFEELEIVQVPREENRKTDLLARMASAVEQSWNNEVTLLFEPKKSSEAQVCAVEVGNDWRTPIIHFLRTGERMEGDTAKYAKYENFYLINDQLYKRSFTHPFLKCLSSEEAEFALREIHQGCCGNHAGYKDLTRKIIRAGFYWPGIDKDTKAYVKKCGSCQRHAPRINIPGEEMGIMYSAHPFDKWGIDIVGKLPTAPGGKCFLIVAVDYFSKWVEAEAVTRVDEATIEKFIWKNICCRYRAQSSNIRQRSPVH
ncbi:uncharacterized protein LOC131018847 [Salvia miltiorrhiza]|uniref:uncharacterized protein LOC131018847 n=1 Tax=Salvia miltiorrhiza TaxID=226208 RepID=UPI0025ABE517|nr:uncharacterized protein LOC131018847 [Salvia miltiorrhiza]